MFFYTDTAGPPWIIVKPDDKKRARLRACSTSCRHCRTAKKIRTSATGPSR